MAAALVEKGKLVRAVIDDSLRGRNLRVPDGEGGTRRLRVNTLRRNILGDRDPRTGLRQRKRQIVFLGDYNDEDARGRVKQALAREIPEKRHRETIDIDVDRYATLSGSYELAQASIYGIDTSKTVVYYNIAPRGAGNGHDENHRGVKWQGEERQGLIFAVTDKGVPIIGVNSGYNFSLVKEHLIGAWRVDFSHDPELQERLNNTQFRSLYVYPEALAILREKKGRKFIGEPLDIKEDIPDAPPIEIADEGRKLTTNILYIDGRDSKNAGYHNQKLLLRESDLPEPIRTSKRLLVTINGVTKEFINTFAFDKDEKPEIEQGQFFLAKGSSGDPKNPWIEANQMYFPAADAFGVDRVTDDLKIVIEIKE